MLKIIRVLGAFSAIITSLCLSSCQKDSSIAAQDILTDSKTIESNTYSGEEFAALFPDLDINVADTKCAALDYVVETMNYNSTGANGLPIELSMKIAYPKGILTKYHDPAYIVLDNHPTICSDVEAPSYNTPYCLVKALDDALVVCPDYEGYGSTVGNDHPYLCHKINAKQSADAVIAAIDYINAKKGIKMKKGYYLTNNGYSQGGGIALATQKYIENSLSTADQEKINLKSTLCGGGPYNPVLTFEKYKEWDELVYPTVAAMQMIGFMAGYSKEFAAAGITDVHQFFTQKFNDSGVIEMIKAKKNTIDEINEYISENFGSAKCSDIFAPELFDDNSAMAKTVYACLKDNDLTQGWSPKAKVTIFHSKGDDVVPVENAEAAYEALKGSGNVTLDYAIVDLSHKNTGILYYAKYLKIMMVAGIANNLIEQGL